MRRTMLLAALVAVVLLISAAPAAYGQSTHRVEIRGEVTITPGLDQQAAGIEPQTCNRLLRQKNGRWQAVQAKGAECRTLVAADARALASALRKAEDAASLGTVRQVLGQHQADVMNGVNQEISLFRDNELKPVVAAVNGIKQDMGEVQWTADSAFWGVVILALFMLGMADWIRRVSSRTRREDDRPEEQSFAPRRSPEPAPRPASEGADAGATEGTAR